MKRILITVCIILLLVLTACSPDVALKVGEYMGKLDTNVYGIPANLQAVDTAVETIDEAVSGTEVTISAETAGAIIESVIAVTDSPTKTEALKQTLTEPVLAEGTAEEQAAVKASIITAADTAKVPEATIAEYDETRQAIANAVNSAIDTVAAGISDNPTKAELATVAALKTISDAVQGGIEYAETGLAALEALKITTDAAQIDLLGNFSITELMNSFQEKGISRGGEEETAVDQYLPMLNKTLSQLSACLLEDGQFSAKKYNKFIFECKAIKLSYDLIAADKEIDLSVKLSEQGDFDKGLTIEDLGLYLIASFAVKANELGEALQATLTDIVNQYGADVQLEDIKDFDFEATNLSAVIDSSDAYFQQVLKTAGVILIDSGYQGLLDLGNGDGTLGSLFAFLGK